MQIKFDYKSLEKAIKNNPRIVAQETKDFLYRANVRLTSAIGKSPWRLGDSGGGAPVRSGNLLFAHRSDFNPFSLRISVDERKAKYAQFVHGGTRNMEGRPWLRYAEKEAENQINEDAERMVKNITDSLGK